MTFGVSLSVSPSSGSAPLNVLISGGVYVVETGQPVATDVSIYRNGVLIKTVRSNGYYGTYETYDLLTEAGTYNYQAKALEASSSIRTVTVSAPPAEKKATTIALVGSPLQGSASLTVSLWATLSDQAGGGVVGRTLDFYVNGNYVFSRTTNSGGKVSASYKFDSQGIYTVFAEFKGNDLYLPSKSNIVTVEVLSPTGTLSVKAQKNTTEVYATVQVGNIATKTTPFGMKLDVGTYELKATFEDQTLIQSAVIEKDKETRILFQFKFVEEPPAPSGATHALKCSYYNLLGLSAGAIEQGVRGIVVPAVNAIIVPLGYDYLDVDCQTGYAPQWQAGYFLIYYKARGTPAIPIALVLTTIIALIVGIVVFWCAWVYLETKKMEYESKKSLDELLKEGYITKEQWEKLREIEEKPSIWDQIMNMLPYLLLFLIIASIAGALPRGRRED